MEDKEYTVADAMQVLGHITHGLALSSYVPIDMAVPLLVAAVQAGNKLKELLQQVKSEVYSRKEIEELEAIELLLDW